MMAVTVSLAAGLACPDLILACAEGGSLPGFVRERVGGGHCVLQGFSCAGMVARLGLGDGGFAPGPGLPVVGATIGGEFSRA